MIKKIASVILFFSCIFSLSAQHQVTTNQREDTQDLLIKLDHYLLKVNEYDIAYESNIAALKAKLRYNNEQSGMQALYKTQDALFQAYDPYQSDSAMHYALQNIQLAQNQHWPAELAKSQINLVHIMNTMGLLVESQKLLNMIDRSVLSPSSLGNYYAAYREYYVYCHERVLGTSFEEDYLRLANIYSDSTMLYIDDSPAAFNMQLLQMVLDDPENAYQHIVDHEEVFTFGSRPYSILLSFKAFACNNLGRREEGKQCLALSAMSDIQASIKENTSLRDLANILYEEGDYERANRYLKSCLSDSQFFNSRLRNSQNSQILPKIDAAYSRLRERHQLIQYGLIGLLTALTLILVMVQLSLHRQKKKVEAERGHAQEAHNKALAATQQALQATQETLKANQQLQDINSQLADSNRIKEEYLGRYMSQCTDYIQQLDSYRKRMYKLSQTMKMSDLQPVLRSEQVIEDTLKEFYQNFDKSFLELFPTFVDKVNLLMLDGEQFHLKGDNQLNSELRILALLRLGIQDNTQMANFLRCSKSTIYTYRSKLKNRSVNPNDFEEQIMRCL